MREKKIILLTLIFSICFIYKSESNPNFFESGKKYFEDKNYEKSKFLFQRNIVFNPKNAESYLYLSKIFKLEGDEQQQEKNLNTTLVLNPKNEEAIYLLINLKINKSDFSGAKELMNQLNLVCVSYCSKQKEIEKKLEDSLPKNAVD